MDRLRAIANGRGVLKGIALFLAFSAAAVLLAWATGYYDYEPADEGGEQRTYQSPTGERRF